MTLKLLLAAAAVILISAVNGEAMAQGLGACAWLKVSEADRQNILGAYHQGMAAGAQALQDHDATLRKAVTDCAGRIDIPMLWEQGLIGSQAIQAYAANELSASGITRTQLDAAWRQAPAAAVDCTRANAAKAYGLMNEPCPDPKASLWFLRTLQIPVQPLDRIRASLALIFYNAKAQTKWAEAFIAKMPPTLTSPPAA